MSHPQQVLAGATLIVAGSWVLYQAYEGSGRRRPWWTKVLPGG